MRPSRALALLLLLTAAAPPAAVAQVGPPVTPTFPNVVQTPGDLLSGLNAPEQGRTAIIAYHGGVLFTVPEVPSSQPGADFIVRTWDLTDPAMPVETGQHGDTPMPINAHGYFKSGEYLVLGPNWPPGSPWTWQATGSGVPLVRTDFPNHGGAGVRGQLFQPWFVGQTFWSYGMIEGLASIELRGQLLAEWDHLGATGVIGHPFLLGDLLIFASDQSRTGVATYDVSDPTNPVLLDVLTTGGAGGYWPELWGGGGRLLVIFPYRTNGNGIRVVDATDPSDLQFVADSPLPGASAMYIQFQDEFAFTGDHKVDMRTFQSVLDLDGANVTRTNDGGMGVDTSQFALPLGNLLVTGGIGPDEGMAIWAHQAAPDTRGPAVGYHVPQAGRTNYPLGAPISLLIHETLETFTIVNGVTFIVQPVGGSPISGRLIFAFDDVLTFTPDAPLLPNTTYEVILPAGGIKDAVGNGIDGYSFTFSTGSAVGGNQPPAVTSLTASDYPVAPSANVTLTATASDPDGDPLEYRFDFGDGTPRTAWDPADAIVHAFAATGHYQVTVQARDPSGSIASGAVTVTVVTPSTTPQPTRSTPVTCDPATRQVWTVNPDNDTVTAVNADTLQVVFERPTCEDPRSVALAGGLAWIACHDSDEVGVHDANGVLVERLDTGYGSAPVGIAATPDGTAVHVALQGAGELARFDVAQRLETGRVTLGPRPRALAVSGDGSRVLVTRLLSRRDHAETWDVDAASMTLSGTLLLPKFGNEENRDTTASGRGVANYLTGIALSPDGTRAWVAANKPNTERGVTFGPDLDQDNSVRNVIAGLDVTTGRLDGSIDLDNSDSASAVAYSPLGDYLFVTLQGNDEVLVLDALRLDSASGLGSIVTRLGAGAAPIGACFDPVTNRTFVKNFMRRSLTVLETDGLFRTGDKSVSSVEVATVATEALAPDVLLGKRIFYGAGDRRMSSEGYLSCASCHLDGGHDGRTWDFTGRGEGFRNTTSLRGRGGLAHGNVHWSANFDEIQDFENDIRNAFGGSGFLSDADWQATEATLGPPKAGLSADLDALATYVTSLQQASIPKSPFRDPSGSMTAEALTGRQVFFDQGCESCHAGATFTDSTLGTATLHDVGTRRTTSGGRLGGPLPGLDTPTLLGAWNTAPYFHDGSAATLQDVFRVAGGVLYQAEAAAVANGANVVDTWVDLNQDNTVHGEAFVGLNDGTLTFTNVEGGSGGLGDLEIRYSFGWPTQLDVTVNGTLVLSTPLTPTANEPQWRQTFWEVLRVEDVPLNPGATNTIVLSNGGAGIDDVLVTTADDRAAADPHRRVLSRPAAEQDALVQYVLQLDGRPDAGLPPGDVLIHLNATDIWWNAAPSATGYDVIEGDLDALRSTGGDYTVAVSRCVVDDTAALSESHATIAGPARFVLVRTVSSAGTGTWDGAGTGQGAPRDAAIAAAAATCP